MLKLQCQKLIKNVLWVYKHQDRLINLELVSMVHTATKPFLSWLLVFNAKFSCDWARKRRENVAKCVENVIFWMLEQKGIWLMYVLSSLIISSGKRARVAVETCRLPFTFAEECWRVFTMLSVCVRDKSSRFINKIDGIAYHQFLLCVFPYKLLCQKHPHYLSSSYPLLSSPGVLGCLNTFCQDHITGGQSPNLCQFV